ncbi:DUF3817 domain-containing protein [Bacillus sp. EB01]|uniref:DUF3817 domain-containing protein n=1 Tax=Bacillus sp. EB01 TaxID=1347086 RepID=UPI0005C52A16|nr:DUF3817 domain-containing protein [Bacillus sp. EB01]
MLKTHIGRFRVIAFLEGLSYLFLLFIAMPLKYIADFPIYVRISGSVHGALFVLFTFFLFLAWMNRKWSIKFAAAAFISSFIPFGMFWLEGKLKREDPGKTTELQSNFKLL